MSKPPLPNPNQVFRPRADQPLLVALFDAAWAQKMMRDDPVDERERAAEAVARYFEARIEPQDLPILKKYGAVSLLEEVNLWAYNESTKGYDQSVLLKLPRPVARVPRSDNAPMYAGGPKWAFQPDDQRGINAETVAAWKESGYWNVFKAKQDEAERNRVREVDPFAAKMVALRTQYRDGREELKRFADDFKSKHDGRYPRWHEIEARIPVLGHFLVAEREAAAAAVYLPVSGEAPAGANLTAGLS